MGFLPIIESNKENSFYCPHCKEITNHLSVSWNERKEYKRSEVNKLIVRLSDATGISDAYAALLGCRNWKCTKCANIHERNSSGKIEDIVLDAPFSDGGEGWKEYDNGFYCGRFFNGLRHGFGTFYFLNGDRFEGQWNNDNRDGPGKYIWDDGTECQGVWKNGELEKWLNE